MADEPLGLALRHIRRLAGMQSSDVMTDGQLLQRFASGHDEAAFSELVERYGGLVHGLCHRILGHSHDADDAFQATFLVLARKAASVRKNDSIGSWLYGVAYRVALKARSRVARRRLHENSGVENVAETESSELHPLAELDQKELRSVLDEELNRLPSKYRAPLILCYLQGKTHDEAAQELGWPRGSMAKRMKGACEVLRQRLTRRGMPLSVAALAAGLTANAASARTASDLLASTVQTAQRYLTEPASVAPELTTLAKGAMDGMFTAKLKTILAVVLTVSLVGTGGVLLMHAASALVPADQNKPADPSTVKAKGKTNPAGVSLEAQLIAKKDTYVLDLGGKTPEAFRKLLEPPKKNKGLGLRPGNFPRSPKVELVYRLKNVGKKDVKVWGAGTPVGMSVDLKGKGAASATPLVAFAAIYQFPTPFTLKPGQTRDFPINSVSYAHPSVGAKRFYWTEPGVYTMTATFHTGVSPLPKGAKPAEKGFGRVTITSAPLKLKVVKQ